MKRALVLVVIFLVLSATILPSPAWAGGGWHHGRHGGHGGWWWPGALIGGLALGVVALATAPLWAFTPAPPPPVVQAPPAVYTQPMYAAVQPVYAPAPVSAAPAPAYAPSQAPPFQREVVYQDGRYLLFGDGVRHPWQWVWVPAATPPAPPPPPR